MKENLVKRLGKKVLPYFLSGALAFSTLFNYRCADGFVEPAPEKPVAMFIAEPTEGYAPLEVSFDGSLSYARKGYLKEYQWDFDGDGNTDTISEQAYINHVYERGGEYDTGLVVVDSQGQRSDKALEKIVVNETLLGQIAFFRRTGEKDYCYGSLIYNDDIYSGNIIIRGDNIELLDVKRLTIHPCQDLEPAWSPNGNEILFTSHRTGGTAVWRMNADGKNQRDITSEIVERARQADWGSNGLIVVAYRDLGDTIAGIGAINPDENFFTPIYSESISGRIPGWPKWSPDCSKIVFQKYIDGNWEIYIMNSDGGELENLTNHPATDQQPAFLPDGNEIFFVSNRNGISEIYSKNLENGDIEQVTNGGGYDPTVSSDGSKIVFISERDSWYYLYMQNLDTGEVTRLTFDETYRSPALRPKRED